MISKISPDYTCTPVSPKRTGILPYQPPTLLANPPITVVTPTFNTGEIILETAFCLLRQSFQQFSWIVVDDGSTDRSGIEALRSLAELDPRITLIERAENRGQSFSRNEGIRRASSPFIFLLDADDLLEPTALEKYLWYLLTHPDAYFCGSYEVGFYANGYLNAFSFNRREDFREENRANITTLLRREVFNQVQFDEFNRDGLEDWEFWISCADAGMWGGVVPEYLNWYRWSENWIEKWKNWRGGKSFWHFRDRLRERYPTAFSKPFPDAESRTSTPPWIPENPLSLSPPIIVDPQIEATGSIVFTKEPDQELEERCYRLTSDVFVLPRFLPERAYPEFLSYLHRSRGCG